MHNDEGSPDANSFKKLVQEMLGVGGYENGKRNNSISVKRTLYGIVKRGTDDFSNGNIYETPEVIGVDSAQQLIDLVK